MQLTVGLHHVTFLTDDIDRLSSFYERVFDAKNTLDMTEEGVRHVFLEIAQNTVLHPFQILDGPPLPPAPGVMFQRGRLDHFALLAPTEETFREIRRRLEERAPRTEMFATCGRRGSWASMTRTASTSK
jgi:catechol 2,3-dioxygenase-like lactoylglutathione lyase family enzyme